MEPLGSKTMKPRGLCEEVKPHNLRVSLGSTKTLHCSALYLVWMTCYWQGFHGSIALKKVNAIQGSGKLLMITANAGP